MGEAYSVDISKYSCKGNKERDYNIKNINKLYENGEAPEVINLLNKNVKDLFLEYCSDEKKEGFVKLKDDLEEIKKNMLKEKEENINEYIEQYKNTANNLENIFIRKSERICKQ